MNQEGASAKSVVLGDGLSGLMGDGVYPGEPATVHGLFELQAALAPEALAVACGDRRWTCGELNLRANRLAHHLRDLGTGPGQLVGLYVDRSVETVLGILAILKAGAAYVPLDPTYPQARLDMMMEEAALSRVVTRDEWREKLSGRVPIVSPDEARLDAPATNPEPVNVPEDLAYVMFTSGTTGRPKGVMITHGNLCHYIPAVQAAMEVTAGDRYLHTASFAFSASGRQLWVPLLNGAAMVIATAEEIADPAALFRLVQREEITILDLVPSYWQSCIDVLCGLEEGERSKLLDSGVRRLFTASEALLTETPRLWRRLGMRTGLVNLYGQTETSGIVSFFPVPEDLDGLREVVPVGRPLPDTAIYLLDPHGGLAPFGVPGEIHVGGAGLGAGYLDRPDLTAERFVPDPVSGRPGERLYRTGDLGRYDHGGAIEFLGRGDNQVKVHGFRVELGAVESTLTQHPGLRQAAVVARETSPGHSRLIAYVVPDPEAPPSAENLRGYLRDHLPGYMVPALFVTLENLPRTATGKIDRGALPQTDQERPGMEQDFVPPRTTLEKRFAHLWEEVLGVERVGIHDNFFSLGGDSILCIQFMARAGQLGFGFDLRTLLRNQTVAELCAAVGRSSATCAEQSVITGPIELSPAHHMFFDRGSPDLHHHNQSFLLEVVQPLPPEVVEAALGHLLLHHDALRLRVRQEGERWHGWIAAPGDPIPFGSIDLSAVPAPDRGAVMEAACNRLQSSLDLTRGPLMRSALFQGGPDELPRLLILIHHLAVDSVSWRVLLEDFHTACRQLLRGEPVRLPAKTSSFRDWTRRLAERARSPEMEAELGYWLTEARSRVRPLPVDNPGGDNSWASNRFLVSALEPDETRALLQQVPRVFQAGVEEVLLTALTRAFNRWSGANSLLFDLANHGRVDLFEDMDLSRSVGWCTATAPVLLELEPGTDPIADLQSVRRQLDAVPDEGIGYRLLRYLSGKPEIMERLRALPEPEVHFSYWGQFDPVLAGSSALVRLSREHPGADTSPRFKRPFLITVSGSVVDGRLMMRFGYGIHLYRRSTVERLNQSFLDEIRVLIARVLAPARAGAAAPKEDEKMSVTQSPQQPPTPAAPPRSAVARPQAVAEPLFPGTDLPLLLRPEVPGLGLADYVKANRRFLEFQLLKHGGVLFRGFRVDGPEDFQQAVEALSGELLSYTYRSTPRSRVAGSIFTSTEYPPDQSIPLHNEMSYTAVWPLKIWFYCVDAADRGGETPIADSRKVYARIPPEVRERMERTGVLYVRNYASWLDLTWQEVFQTASREEVEAYCRQAGIDFEWKGEDHLCTRQICQAVTCHPSTGEPVWFNQAHLFHVSGLGRDARDFFLAEFGEAGLPRNTYYGDGAPIEDEVLEKIREAYRQEALPIPWQDGDVMLLDNVLVAHGRAPFEGSRKVLVGMAEPSSGAEG